MSGYPGHVEGEPMVSGQHGAMGKRRPGLREARFSPCTPFTGHVTGFVISHPEFTLSHL